MSIKGTYTGKTVGGNHFTASELVGEGDNCTLVQTSSTLVLDTKTTAALATFLLAAAGHDTIHKAIGEFAPQWAKTLTAVSDRASLADKRLAAVLALQAEDIAEAWLGVPFTRIGGLNEKMANRVLDLIRSRATEGAEATTGGAA